MIVDTSAVMTILFDENGSERYDETIAEATSCRMSIVSFVEAAMVLEGRRGTPAGQALDNYLEAAGIELVPVTLEQAFSARRARRRFGKGNHPAGLDFGDCFAYALAETTREPLLFKGRDFALTDIEAA